MFSHRLEYFRPDKKTIAGTAVFLVLSLFLLITGIQTGEADATCRATEFKCHGMPLQDSCIGYESSKTSFDSKKQCSVLKNITARCERLGNQICSINNQSIGTKWAGKTKVFGKSCRSWAQTYSIDLRSC